MLFVRYKNGEPLESTEHIKIEKKEGKTDLSLSLIIDACVVEDAGKLKIHAKNPVGEASCTAELKVQSMYPAPSDLFHSLVISAFDNISQIICKIFIAIDMINNTETPGDNNRRH